MDLTGILRTGHLELTSANTVGAADYPPSRESNHRIIEPRKRQSCHPEPLRRISRLSNIDGLRRDPSALTQQ